MRLTAEQDAALAAVAVAQEAYKGARATLERRIRERMAAELGALEAARDRAVFAADRAGVPRRRIGADGLGTKNPGAVYAILGTRDAVEEAAAAGVRLGTDAEAAAAQVQPGEVLAHSPRGLVLHSPAFDGVPSWHAVTAAGAEDVARSAELVADAALLAELEMLRAAGPRSGDTA